MKPVHVKSNKYTDFGVESNDKDPKFKVGEQVRTSKYSSKFFWRKFSVCVVDICNRKP